MSRPVEMVEEVHGVTRGEYGGSTWGEKQIVTPKDSAAPSFFMVDMKVEPAKE